jgi:CRP/FNR family cyclic AMP-dependent transcriptional regulator
VVTTAQYKSGEIIIRENDQGESAYVINSGRVEVTKYLRGKNIHLTYLYPGETFGEMSMIDDKPRSATVTAADDTEVGVIQRDQFLETLNSNPEVALKLLKTVFERFREASAMIAQLQKDDTTVTSVAELEPLDFLIRAGAVVLAGATPKAAQALPQNPLPIKRFPFRIGRKSNDPLAHNDLYIPDSAPFRVSRHHVALVKHGGHIGVMDRGSTLGAIVDGQPLGGKHGNPGPVLLGATGGTLILGTEESPFRFQLVVGRERDVRSD